MLGSFLIFLREGVEGSMICAILLTYLAAGGRRDLFRWVVGGALLAAGLSALAGTGLYLTIRTAFVGSTAQTWVETGTFVVAVGVLTYMTFWMKGNARSMVGSLRTRAHQAVSSGSGLALGAVAFVTVGREAMETAIFIIAIALKSKSWSLVTGATAGVVLALVVSFAIYRLGMKIDMRRLFTFMGAALMVVAAGLLSNAIQNLQTLRVLPGGGHGVWDTSAILPDDGRPGLTGAVGDILHGLLGYASSPTALQLATYAIFLAVGLTLFLRTPTRSLSRG